METEKDVLMFYQTSLRNVGLYTSISFGLLASSRFYREKNKIYNILFIVLSLLVLLCSITLCKYLLDDLKIMKKNLHEIKYLNKWETIPQIIYYVNIAVGLICVTTLFKQLSNK
jgi:hypothetical protein|tara:strand:- start:209 stop:550 length:342 start_codon:yes stop_codon:yes gene_type:complete